MSNLQLIEALCGLVETMSKIIRHQAVEIEQYRALTEAERNLLDGLDGQLAEILNK